MIAQPVLVEPLPSKFQADAPPKITYQWEAFSRIASELKSLLPLHWEEVALKHKGVPLEPDWERYFRFELAGYFKIVTVRDHGRLVGYSTWLILPHLHHASALWAHNDVMWIDPLYRQGFTGVRMLRTALKGLRAMGVRVVHATTMDHFEKDRGGLGRVFEFLGFERIQSVYALDLGERDEQRQSSPTPRGVAVQEP